MNKKGFTLVEVLASLAILSFITGIAIIAYTSIVARSKLRVFKLYEKTMYAETVSLLTEAAIDPSKASLFPSNNETKTFSLNDIGIEPIKNPRNKDDLCVGSYVEVKREDYNDTDSNTYVDAFKYKICLICPYSDYNVTGNSCLFIPDDSNDSNSPTP